MKLESISVRDLLPIFMRRDDFDVALADALSKPLQVFARECRKLSTFDALQELSEAELDALAEELNVLWYDRASTLEQKRALIAQSDLVYMRLGTKAAVKSVVDTVFGEATVQEFWEYNGRPHYFRIRVQNIADLNDELEAKLIRLLDIVKRKSQWLQGIVAVIEAQVAVRAGVLISSHIDYTIHVDEWQNNLSTAGARAGGSAIIENAEDIDETSTAETP